MILESHIGHKAGFGTKEDKTVRLRQVLPQAREIFGKYRLVNFPGRIYAERASWSRRSSSTAAEAAVFLIPTRIIALTASACDSLGSPLGFTSAATDARHWVSATYSSGLKSIVILTGLGLSSALGTSGSATRPRAQLQLRG